MGMRILSLVLLIGLNLGFTSDALARIYNYPQTRYINSADEALAGVVVPTTDEVGNMLMNNPAALAKVSGYRAEPLNLNFVANDHSVSNISSTLGKTFSLGGIASTMNSNPGSPFGVGISNLSAFAWNGLAFGLCLQEYSRAQSDGTTATYFTTSQFIPSVGWGFGMARDIIRLGYSLQYVNQTSGKATAVSNSGASFLSGLQKGSGFSHNASVNFAFPFTYLPTISFMVRNLGGLHFTSSSLLSRAKNPTGAPGDEAMTIDMSFDFLVRISGTTKTHFYYQYRDFSNKSGIQGIFNRLSTGIDLALSPSFILRVGMTGIAQFSAGVAYRGTNSEIGLSYYNEPSPFSSTWDTKYALQYKVQLGTKAKKSRELQQVGNKR